MHSCDNYRRLTAEKAAARRPDCGPLATKCLNDAAVAISAGTGSAALIIEIVTGSLGTPVSTVLGGISVFTGFYSTMGTCAYDGAGQCVVSGLSSAFSAAAPFGGVLRAVGIVGRDAEVAWRLTWQFMAQPFTLTGPLLWLHEVTGQ
jgi:hypothetical protein